MLLSCRRWRIYIFPTGRSGGPGRQRPGEGSGTLARLIWEQEVFSSTLEEYGQPYLDPEKELNSIEEVYQEPGI